MPYNGAGTFSVYTPGNPVVTGTTISSTVNNNTNNDFATGLTTAITKDGQTTPTANLPMGTFKLTGLGNGSARTDSIPIGQVQDGSFIYVATVGGTADVITLTPSPAITAYAAGQTFRFIASGANTTNVTVNVSGLGAKAVTKNGTTALIAADIASGVIVNIQYDGTQFQLLNVSSTVTTTGTQTLTNKTINLTSNTLTGTAAQFNTACSDDDFAYIGAANAFTGVNTFTTTTGQNALKIISTHSGTSGPRLTQYHNSGSPAVSDVISEIYSTSKNAGAGDTDYARIACNIKSVSDMGSLQFSVLGASGIPVRLTIEDGIQVGTPTGADKGTGTANIQNAIYVNNVAVPTISSTDTLTNKTLDLPAFTGSSITYTRTNEGNTGPQFNLFHETTTPAVGDTTFLTFMGRNSIGTSTTYGRMYSYVADPTNGTEDGELILSAMVNNALSDVLRISNGVQIGAPTGSYKGTGTLNLQADIYKNNTAYTNPDYVFEHFYTGKIEKFKNNDGAKDYQGLPDLSDFKKYTEQNLRLPGISDDPMGAFDRSEKCLQLLEQAFLYIYQLEDRLKVLESE